VTKINFATTNNLKFKYFQNFLMGYPNIKAEQLKVETPEIQAKTNKEVAKFSAKWISQKHNCPIIVEDVGFYLEALNGFPGPYLKHVETWIKAQGFFDLLKNKTNRKAKFELCVSYCEPGKTPIAFSTYHFGSIGHEIKGKGGFIVDKIFIPDGEKQTIAELIDEGKIKRNQDHYQKLILKIFGK
jgi:XTP/dITP diphosphohydrolase